MLQEVEVNGFKSLKSFKFNIRPGLNVFVGPNGSGKSNIILFFEFLSHLCSATAMNATSRVGGAGAIFSIIGKGKLNSQLSFTVNGQTEFRNRFEPGKTYQIDYEYKAVIDLVEDLSTLGFCFQELKINDAVEKQENNNLLLNIKWKGDGINHEILEAYISDDEFLRNSVYFVRDD